MKSMFLGGCVAAVLMHGSPLWAEAAQNDIETHLLGLIKQFSLTETNEAACLQDIRRELDGRRGDKCFGPFDRIIGGWKEEAARKNWQEDDDTVSVNVPGDWAYVRIARFGLNTADEFYAAVSNIEQDHIVLDLRQNGGGRLDQAIKMALMVVDPKGNDPVYTETKRDSDAEDFRLITKPFVCRNWPNASIQSNGTVLAVSETSVSPSLSTTKPFQPVKYWRRSCAA